MASRRRSLLPPISRNDLKNTFYARPFNDVDVGVEVRRGARMVRDADPVSNVLPKLGYASLTIGAEPAETRLRAISDSSNRGESQAARFLRGGGAGPIPARHVSSDLMADGSNP